MTALRALLVVGCLALWACASPTTTPSPAPSVSPVPSPSASAATSSIPIVLRETPADLGCDSIPVDYTRVIFHIDPAAAEPVTATTDKGVSLVTYWPAGYTADETGIRDNTGMVVITDRQPLHVNEQRIHGSGGTDLCWGLTTLYVSPAASGG